MNNAAYFWDALAEDYAKKPIANVPAYQRKLVETRKRLQPEHTVLDIGCGTGSLALELSPDVDHVHSVDISTEMVKIGRRKVAARGVDNVTFYTQPFDEVTTFEPESFDVVCAYNILHLLPDYEAALVSIVRLLKPGGCLVSSTPCLAESWMPYRLILPVMRLLGKAPPVHICKVAGLEGTMRVAGLSQIERPDVGAAKHTAFLIAVKPPAT